MAIKTATPRPSKRTVMSMMVLILLGWLILMGWVSSLWCFSGFEKALHVLTVLSQKQTQAITEFNSMTVTNAVKSWFGNMPTHELTDKVVQTSVLIKNSINEVIPDENDELNDIAEDFIYIGKQVWLLMRLTTQVMFTKLIILVSAIPLFLLTTTAGLVDGLNQRAIRTASLGRESSYVFHQLNRYFKRGLFLLLSLWLALPVSITPALVFVPVSLLLSLMVSVTASRFKKYL
ncbi:TIGR03747 family integrating conjugative element membrane protein [Legionella pneumophila serogroup 1]|uniref:TIGR03747 family integrating conjugative element membrane protein n=1 Tax=Legionella pneumophila TaxID=446 RepID=UPI000576C2B5|nr:TIGR03747 family integrating conjugative element membrane protein [Legionella pneumophila]HAT9040391.1 TIGR03747 family integrating conjugative element membrane protein [Legionella pneumophila subsp. pneumophila]TIE23335.1 TIGR03747 family integrating conjugative element membrane protein [Legionella pneumophila]TIE29262.1 TIGR03747 family integrating conjugative element membrane protein [Legionella pneumophila]TIE50767.1 TIGR03747 family integrating conjugative element membrane protein [Legi